MLNKKMLSLLFAGSLVLGACGVDENPTPSEEPEEDETEEVEVVEEEEVEEEEEVVESNEETATISVTIGGQELEGTPLEVSIVDELTVMDYMIENFETVGAEEGFLTSIDGHEQDEDDGKYWMFFVDDEMAPVGADEYVLEADEYVEWRLEALD